MASTFRQFGQILKTEDQEDGTIKVFGIASSGSEDLAGETITPDAMKAALPDYEKFPALREMHNSTAAGRVIEASVDADGFTQICAHVVDPVAISKVKHGVYSGFSIGGKVTKRDPSNRSTITALRLVEISLVDSPCNPDAILNMWKAESMSEYTPVSGEVLAKAKEIAKANGTKRFSDFLFDAHQELKADYILKHGMADLIAETAGDDTIGKIVANDAAKGAIVDPEDSDHGGEGTDGPIITADEVVSKTETPIVEVTAEVEVPAEDTAKANEPVADVIVEPVVAADPAAALNAALAKAIEAVVPAAPANPFADIAKAAAALKSINTGEAVAKGMYQVSRFAELLSSFASLQECAEYEAEHEGDNSPIPAALAEQIKALGALLVAMTQEEVAELIAETCDDEANEIVVINEDGDVFALANSIIDTVKANEDLMAKAGARHSKADAESVQTVHDHAMKLGAMCEAKNCPVEEETEVATSDSKKSAELSEENERLAKALGDAAPAIDSLTKRFTDTVDTLKAEIAELTTKFATLDQTPLPSKTAGSAQARVVTKGLDSSGQSDNAGEAIVDKESFDKAMATLTAEERSMILTKIALSQPHVIANRTV